MRLNHLFGNRTWTAAFALGLAALQLTTAHEASAADSTSLNDDYFKIESVTIRSLGVTDDSEGEALPPSEWKSEDLEGARGLRKEGGTGALDVIGDIVNIGKQIWPVIVENKPVVNVKTDVAHALPKGMTPFDLENWRGPKTATYEVAFTNKLGVEVVRFGYQVRFEYGGKLGGKGEYVTNATVVPQDVKVLWGYTLNADTQVLQVTNRRTTADPLASLTLVFHWKISTILQDEQKTASFMLNGNGELITD